MFDTKIAIVVGEDLLAWQKLNVTAFLTSGVLGADGDLLGETYQDASGQIYRPLIIQPIIVLATDRAGLTQIHKRVLDRGVRPAIYIEDMFATGHDAANRGAVKRYATDELPLVGLAIRGEKKIVDKITKRGEDAPMTLSLQLMRSACFAKEFLDFKLSCPSVRDRQMRHER